MKLFLTSNKKPVRQNFIKILLAFVRKDIRDLNCCTAQLKSLDWELGGEDTH